MDKALTLRLPPEIHDRATAAADSLGLTLSAYIRLALVEHSRWKLKESTASTRQLSARRPAYAARAERSDASAAAAVAVPIRRPTQSLNSPCACGSGRKFKRCCGEGVL